MNATGGFIAGSIVAKLLLDKTGWNASIKALATDQRTMTSHFGRLGASVQMVGVVAAAAVSAAAIALGVMVKKTAEAGDALWDMSQRTGIAVEILSGLKLAADKSGTSLEGVAVGLRFLGRNMAAGIDSFKQMGISIKNANGELRPMQDVMLEVADRFAGMENGAGKSALAMKLFGRSGTELIPMLNLGSAGLREQISLAEKLGMVFTEKTARAADAFNDTMVDLRASLTGMRNDIGNALIPVFTKLAAATTDALAFIRGKLKEFTESGKLQEWAVSVARVFIGAFQLMGESVAGLMLLLPSLKASIFSVAEGFYGILSRIADGMSLLPGVSAQAGVALRVMAGDLKDFAATYGKAADDNKNKVSEIRAAAGVLLTALDMISKGFGKMGGISKKTFSAMAAASRVTTEEMSANLAKLAADLERQASLELVEIPIEFDFSNLDAAIPPDILKDLTDAGAQAAAEASKKIRDMLSALGPEGLAAVKNEIAAINITLEEFGEAAKDAGLKLPDAEIQRLKDRLRELKAELKDMTPLQEFGSNMERIVERVQEAVQIVSAAVSGYVNQARTNAEISVENEYKTRLAYINKNMTDEEARQKAVTALEAEYQIKRTEAARKGAALAKAVALMEAIVNTASGVARAFKDFPFPISAIIAGIVGALGAVQVGLIAAQPIPLAEGATFEKSTILHDVEIGEKGREHVLQERKLVQIVREAVAGTLAKSAPQRPKPDGVAGSVFPERRFREIVREVSLPLKAMVAPIPEETAAAIAPILPSPVPTRPPGPSSTERTFREVIREIVAPLKAAVVPVMEKITSVIRPAPAGETEKTLPGISTVERTLREIIRETVTPTRFLGAPAMAMAGAGGGGATITWHQHAPLISTTGLARRDLEAAGEELRRIVGGQLRRVGRGI